MYCPYCGKSNEDGSTFCEHCGEPLGDDIDMESPAEDGRDGGEALPGDGPQPEGGSDGGGRKAALIAAVVAVVAVAAILVGVLAAGGGGDGETGAQESSEAASEESPSSEHKIVFETSGGSTCDPLSAASGDLVTSPAEPTKSGAEFEGWYFDQGLTMQVSFPYTVKDTDPETIIFYAKWNLDGVSANVSASNGSHIGNGYAGNGQTTYYENCIFPYSSSEYLTEADVSGLSDWQLQRATNEIFARNGYIFQKNAEEKAFFESQSWYHGTETDQTVVKSRFNDIELANVQLLTSHR